MPVFIFRGAKTAFLVLFIAALMAWPNSLSAKSHENVTIPPTIGACQAANGNDIAKARECAISDALVEAVELAFINLVPRETIIENFKSLDAVLYKGSDIFIRDYKVLTESMSGDVYRVLVQATILSNALKQRMINDGVAPDTTDKEMKTALVIVQGDIGSLAFHLTEKEFSTLKELTSSSISTALKRNGFLVIAEDLNAPFQNPSAPNEEEIMAMAKSAGADVVILSNVTIQDFAKRSERFPNLYQGSLSLRVFLGETGERIGSLGKISEIAHNLHDIPDLREAVSHAGIMVGDELPSLIYPHLIKETEQSLKVTVIVEEKIFFPYFVMFKKELEKISGVSNIQTKEMMSNTATLVATFRGDSRALSKALKKKKHGSFSLFVTKITPDGLTLRIRARQK